MIVCTTCLADSGLTVQAAANNPTKIVLSSKNANMSVEGYNDAESEEHHACEGRMQSGGDYKVQR